MPADPRPPTDHRAQLSCTRRRALGLLAATSAGALASLLDGARAADALEAPPVTWHGQALGAPVEVRLYHSEPAIAQAAITEMQAEIKRLEAIFSLYLPDSTICRLNRDGMVNDAPPDMLALLALCRRLHELTDGAFDPTVQPLWALYSAHFAGRAAAPQGPPPPAIVTACRLVGLPRLVEDERTLRFCAAGMMLTLNGIAQGYLTDRARDILAVAGMRHALLNLGEYRALGARPDGRAWHIAVTDPVLPWRLVARIALRTGMAIATSAGAGTPFDPAMRHHHLLDPHTGRSAHSWRSVTVTAGTAALADGLSTALAVAPRAQAQAIVARFPGAGALFYGADGRVEQAGTGLSVL